MARKVESERQANVETGRACEPYIMEDSDEFTIGQHMKKRKEEPIKVKYSRREYREEYLKSEEWSIKRNSFMASRPICEKCGKNPSCDARHCNYRNIVDVKDRDLLAVCRECHNLIEEAKNCKMIPNNHNRYIAIKITREQVDKFKSKSFTLDQKFVDDLIKISTHGQMLIRGILKISSFVRWEDTIGWKIKINLWHKILLTMQYNQCKNYKINKKTGKFKKRGF
ncbi:MAG: hypothetical protein WC390_06490 [Sulfurimonas sp.]